MEHRVTLRLFVMGLCGAVLACVLTGVVLMRAFVGQMQRDLRQEAQRIAASYDGSSETLARYARDDLYITLVAPDGAVRYESMEDAEGRRDALTCTQPLSDGSSLVTRRPTDALYAAVARASGYLLALLMALGLLLIALSVQLTRQMLRPIRRLAENVADVTLHDAQKDAFCVELTPFVRELQRQRRQLAAQQEQLEEERAKLSLVIAHISEGLIVLDGRNRIMALNQSARDSLMLPAHCEGENLLYLAQLPGLNEILGGSDSPVVIHRGERVYRVFADRVMTANLRVGAVLLLVDVTNTLKLERMRQEFTANVSHEMKTPLTSISGYAEMIEAGIAQSQDVQRFAARIHKEASRMITLIGDIMRLSALDEESAAFTSERIVLVDLAGEVIEAQELSALKHDVHITLTGDRSCVMGDRTLIREMIHNLIDNAVRYNRPGGSVEVCVEQGLLTVRDTGIGIPAQSRERVFERFYRVDKSRSRETGGTGLGLAIVRHVAQLYKAPLRLESEEGVGTTISVHFKAA